MKLYEIIVKPLSGFGTPLKGDTLFGHFCWQAAYDPSLLNGGLKKWIFCYGEKPFVVFSSAWSKIEDNGKFFYAFKRPDMPISFLFSTSKGNKREAIVQLKENKKKKWMKVDESLSLDLNCVGNYSAYFMFLLLFASENRATCRQTTDPMRGLT